MFHYVSVDNFIDIITFRKMTIKGKTKNNLKVEVLDLKEGLLDVKPVLSLA